MMKMRGLQTCRQAWGMIPILMIGALLLSTDNSEAALIAHESFSYLPSDAVIGATGGTGWSDAWQNNATSGAGFAPAIVNGSLPSPGGAVETSGNRVRLTNPDTDGSVNAIYRTFATAVEMDSNNTYYYSFMMRKESTATSSANLEFSLMPTPLSGNGLRFGISSNNLFFLQSTNNTAPTPDYAVVASNDPDESAAYQVVIKVEASDIVSDAVSAWIYRPTDVVSLVETGSPTLTTTLNSTTSFNKVRLWTGANSSGSFDEIRVGTTWADVVPPSAAAVPEPAAFVLVGLGLAAAVGVRFGRRQK